MTTIRMIAAHEVVSRIFPRPPPGEKDLVARAIGTAIDQALAEFGYQLRQGRRPTVSGIVATGGTALDEALAEAAVTMIAEDRAAAMTQVEGVVRAYRQSEIAGLARPKTRVVLIGKEVGLYAQPDFWDGRGRFFEMKSYSANPVPADVLLQLHLFQLAYPGFEAVLVSFDRRSTPVTVASTRISPQEDREVSSLLRQVHALGREFGQPKVLEYVEGPFVSYEFPPRPEPSTASSTG